MKNKREENVIKWLHSKPPLEELGREFPELRDAVRLEVSTIISSGSPAELQAYLKQLSNAERISEKKYMTGRGNEKNSAALVQQALHTRIAHLTIRQHLVSEATGIEKGRVRFNLLNGYIAQKLLFSDGLERKPVSNFWFSLVWPLLWQKRLLMPLVQPEGIYCFYSQKLIKRIAELIGGRTCLEIAAGDGTLARFLAGRRVSITATDDYSWSHEVTYPESVVRRDAQDALREFTPEVVLCSWPPAGNSFERQVFRTKSVQLYVVISSRHRFASGNWDDYLQQSTFDFEEECGLSSLVFPPALDAAVYVFRRKPIG